MKRLDKKINKAARKKIIEGEPLKQSERIVFKKHMETWLGNDIVQAIKQFGKVETK